MSKMNCWDWLESEVKHRTRTDICRRIGVDAGSKEAEHILILVKQARDKQAKWLKEECENFKVDISNTPSNPSSKKIIKKAVLLSDILNHIKSN